MLAIATAALLVLSATAEARTTKYGYEAYMSDYHHEPSYESHYADQDYRHQDYRHKRSAQEEEEGEAGRGQIHIVFGAGRDIKYKDDEAGGQFNLFVPIQNNRGSMKKGGCKTCGSGGGQINEAEDFDGSAKFIPITDAKDFTIGKRRKRSSGCSTCGSGSGGKQENEAKDFDGSAKFIPITDATKFTINRRKRSFGCSTCGSGGKQENKAQDFDGSAKFIPITDAKDFKINKRRKRSVGYYQYRPMFKQSHESHYADQDYSYEDSYESQYEDQEYREPHHDSYDEDYYGGEPSYKHRVYGRYDGYEPYKTDYYH